MKLTRSQDKLLPEWDSQEVQMSFLFTYLFSMSFTKITFKKCSAVQHSQFSPLHCKYRCCRKRQPLPIHWLPFFNSKNIKTFPQLKKVLGRSWEGDYVCKACNLESMSGVCFRFLFNSQCFFQL